MLGGAAGNVAAGMAAGKAGSAAAGRIGGRAAGETAGETTTAKAGAQAESRAAAGARRDFTDYRTDAEMLELHRQLRSIKPQAEDFLYTPRQEHVAGSLSKTRALANNLQKDLGVIASPVEVAPGQFKLRVDKVPPSPSLPELKQSLGEMYDAMLRGESRKIQLGIVGPEEAARIKARTKTDTLLNVRELDSDWIGHAISRHGNEKTLGQVSITRQDFMRYAEILLDPHNIESTRKANTIQYSRRYPDGTVYVLEQQVRGNKLEFRTLWKQSLGGEMVPILTAAPVKKDEGE